MSGFSAAKVEKLDYDFTAAPIAVQPEPPADAEPASVRVAYCSGRGVVPEPTEGRLERFWQFVANEAFAVRTVEEGAEEQAKAPAEAPRVEMAAELGRLRAAVADVCHGSPSRAQIDELPPRVLTEFFRWLMGELAPKG